MLCSARSFSSLCELVLRIPACTKLLVSAGSYSCKAFVHESWREAFLKTYTLIPAGNTNTADWSNSRVQSLYSSIEDFRTIGDCGNISWQPYISIACGNLWWFAFQLTLPQGLPRGWLMVIISIGTWKLRNKQASWGSKYTTCFKHVSRRGEVQLRCARLTLGSTSRSQEPGLVLKKLQPILESAMSLEQ